MAKQMIIPHFWYEQEAVEAAHFYVSIFGGTSQIKDVSTVGETPSGSVDIVSFAIWGQEFEAISAGPQFKINPAISFHVRCRTTAEVDQMWEKLSPGGSALMELGQYPFSKRYGWIQDRYGVSWQVIHTEEAFTQGIMPALMFTQDLCGKAEEAIHFYASIFPQAEAQVIARYEKGEAPDQEGTVKYAEFTLNGQEFAAMDSALIHDFKFNEALSLILNCKDQAEIDHYWEKLSAVAEAEQCGWIKDKYGVSWQILPENMGELMAKDPQKTTPVMLAMKKIIIEDLQKAAAG